jgi:hypothetical protein
LHDQALLPVGNIVPVGFKATGKEHITAKHKLCGRGVSVMLEFTALEWQINIRRIHQEARQLFLVHLDGADGCGWSDDIVPRLN